MFVHKIPEVPTWGFNPPLPGGVTLSRHTSRSARTEPQSGVNGSRVSAVFLLFCPIFKRKFYYFEAVVPDIFTATATWEELLISWVAVTHLEKSPCFSAAKAGLHSLVAPTNVSCLIRISVTSPRITFCCDYCSLNMSKKLRPRLIHLLF